MHATAFEIQTPFCLPPASTTFIRSPFLKAKALTPLFSSSSSSSLFKARDDDVNDDDDVKLLVLHHISRIVALLISHGKKHTAIACATKATGNATKPVRSVWRIDDDTKAIVFRDVNDDDVNYDDIFLFSSSFSLSPTFDTKDFSPLLSVGIIRVSIQDIFRVLFFI